VTIIATGPELRIYKSRTTPSQKAQPQPALRELVFGLS
jgi:hypothetical protein